MAEITLTLHNRTNLDLLFTYNNSEYDVSAKGVKVIKVEAGHIISVYPPKNATATRDKRFVEFEYHVHELQKNSIVECKLVGWNLSLNFRPDII